MVRGRSRCSQRRHRRRPRGVDHAGGGQDADGDGQVETAGFLGQVGRRQVDRDALVVREAEAAVLQRGAHAFTRLLDLGVGQPHQREAGQAVGQLHFHVHRQRGHAVQRAAHDNRQAHLFPPGTDPMPVRLDVTAPSTCTTLNIPPAVHAATPIWYAHTKTGRSAGIEAAI